MEAITRQVAEISVVYKPKVKMKDAPQVMSSAEVHQILRAAYDQNTIAIQEQFVVMYLNRANRVIGLYKVSTGGLTGTVADPRLIMATGLKVAAVSIILSHNHPSGSLHPSRADEELTRRIAEGARLLDMKVIDHVILEPSGGYLSFADEGLI